MLKTRLRGLLLIAGLLAALGLGLARSAAEAIDEFSAALTPSSAPALLGPVDAGGRTGWDCAPERAAGAEHAADAKLPAD